MTKYSDVCEAEDEETCQRLFSQLLQDLVAQHGGSTESHRARQLSNVGYFAGYYGPEVGRRLHKWLGATHPVFGTAIFGED